MSAFIITPNAAALSWEALNEALRDRAEMEGALLRISNSTTKVSLDEAKVQATNVKREQEDLSKQTIMDGVGSMVGAAVQGAVSSVSSAMESRNNAKANALRNGSTDTEVVATQKSLSTDTESTPTTQGSAELKGENTSGFSDETTNSAKKEDNTQNEFDRKAYWWNQNSRTFSEIAGQVTSGLTKVSQTGWFGVGTNYIADQGQAKAAQAIAQGIATVMNTQTSSTASAISSCDSNMQNTNSIISAIIQASHA